MPFSPDIETFLDGKSKKRKRKGEDESSEVGKSTRNEGSYTPYPV
jgi:hypothetical protein